MFLNKFPKIPSPFICFILENLDFNLSQFMQILIYHNLCNYQLDMVYYL